MLEIKGKNYGFDTLMVHAGTQPDPDTHAVALPIYQTTAYTFDSVDHAARLFELKEAGNIYSRMSDPTVDALERRIAALDGGIGALAMSSVRFVDPDDLDAWEAAVNERTKAFFVEGIGNPNANVADIGAIAEIAHRHGIPMVVDSTFTTPYLQRPIEYGADFVIHSATKFLGGHGTAMCGIVTDAGTFDFSGNPRFPLYNEPDVSYHGVVFAKDCGKAGFITRLRTMMLRDLGACCAPLNAFLIMQGIETLSLRMRRISDSALEIARHLKAHPDVAFVNYPGLESSRYYDRVQRYLPKGAGGVFTFGLHGGRERGARLIDSLELIMHVTNVGDARTLISHPASTTHSQLSDGQLAESGIRPETVRLSVGLEDPADLIADLDQAIAAAK